MVLAVKERMMAMVEGFIFSFSLRTDGLEGEGLKWEKRVMDGKRKGCCCCLIRDYSQGRPGLAFIRLQTES